MTKNTNAPIEQSPEFTAEAVAESIDLEVLTIRAILDGATWGPEIEPRAGNRTDRKLLLENFEKTCGVIAGIDSGSSWVNHETGQRAEINVRSWNSVTVEEAAPVQDVDWFLAHNADDCGRTCSAHAIPGYQLIGLDSNQEEA